MAIELVSTIKQKNNGQFPIAEANDIKGGYYSVASIEERDNIPLVRRTAGMLCYVLGDKIYKLNDDLEIWEEFTVSGSANSNGIFIGTTPPPDDAPDIALWIDTSDEVIDENIPSDILTQLSATIEALNNRILSLEEEVVRLRVIVESGTTGGDTPTPPTIEGVELTLEDGSIMTFEDDTIMLF